MRRMKKWVALISVIAILITVFVPANSLALGESPAAQADSVQPESRAARAGGPNEVKIIKNTAGELDPASGLQDTQGVATVLVKNSDVTIALEIQEEEVSPNRTYKWTRHLDGGSERDADLGESPSPSYYAETRNGDLQNVGTYTYTCQPYDNGTPDTSVKPIQFTVKTVGTSLQLSQGQNKNIGPYEVEELEEEEGPDKRLLMSVELASQTDFSSVNVGTDTISITAQTARRIFRWTSEQLGSDFDEYPYNATIDEFGAKFDAGTNTASFQPAVAYNEGTATKPDWRYANQIAAGANTIKVKADGMGIDPAQSEITFSLTVIPQLVPKPQPGDTASPVSGAADYYEYAYATTNASLPVYLVAAWEKGLIPANVSYAWTWTRQSDGAVQSQTTTARALSCTVDTPKSEIYEFVCAPRSTAVDHWYDSETVTMNAKYRVNVEKDFKDPAINAVTAELNNGTKLTEDSNHRVKVPQGDDLILRVDATSNMEVGRELTYKWVRDETGQGGPGGVEIPAASTADYLIEDGGATLRILNVQRALDGTDFQVTATNKGGKTAQKYITVRVEDATVPKVSLSSDPAAVQSVVTVREKNPFTLTIAETGGVSAGSLAYAWEQTTSVDKDGAPTNWQPAEGTNDQNPYSVDEAQRTLNDVVTFYRCVVTNTSGVGSAFVVESAPVRVRVNPITGTVTIYEPTQTIEREIVTGQGSNLTFGVRARLDTEGDIGYQWYRVKGTEGEDIHFNESDAIPGATADTYAPGKMSEAGYFVFKCKAYNMQDESEATWSVDFIVKVTQSEVLPIVETVGELERGTTENGYLRMRVEAYTVSSDPLIYQWLENSGTGWTEIEDANRPSLTVSNLKREQTGTQYKCRVTNLKQNVSNESKPITIKVWRQDDMPVILTQPKSFTLQSGTAEAAAPTLKTIVASTADSKYVFNWQVWNVPRQEWVDAGLDQIDINTDETATSALEFHGTNAENGRYRCQVINRSADAENATVYTAEADAYVMMRNVPVVLRAPDTQQVTEGKTVTLRVIADIFPDEELLYTWRVSDDGTTWRNCGPSDGSGYDTAVFTTTPMAQTRWYRCIVEGAVNRVQAPEDTTARITVVPIYPQLEPARTSKLEITQDAATGERYLRGYLAGTDDLMLTVKGVREDLTARDLNGTGGKYTIEVRDKNGNVLHKDDDRVTTGATATLLLTNEPGADEPIVADEVTLVILGDVVGTGKITISQLVSMANHMLGDRLLPEGPRREAADINGNGKCDIGDLSKAAKLLIGEED